MNKQVYKLLRAVENGALFSQSQAKELSDSFTPFMIEEFKRVASMPSERTIYAPGYKLSHALTPWFLQYLVSSHGCGYGPSVTKEYLGKCAKMSPVQLREKQPCELLEEVIIELEVQSRKMFDEIGKRRTGVGCCDRHAQCA